MSVMRSMDCAAAVVHRCVVECAPVDHGESSRITPESASFPPPPAITGRETFSFLFGRGCSELERLFSASKKLRFEVFEPCGSHSEPSLALIRHD